MAVLQLGFNSMGCNDQSIVQVASSFVIDAVLLYKLVVANMGYEGSFAIKALLDTGRLGQLGIKIVAAAEQEFDNLSC